MFVKYQRHVQQAVAVVRPALLRPPAEWLPSPGVSVERNGRFLARVGFGPPGLHISKQVELTVGEAQRARDWLDIPIGWKATGPSDLFPVLEGHLRLEPVDPNSSRLSLSGSYLPPLGAVGREADDAVMHNLAEATIRDFVDGVAARISEIVEKAGD